MSLLDKLRGRNADEMNCKQVAKVLQAVLDGEQDDRVTDLVSEHLEACRRCGLEADTYLRIKSSLARRADGIDTEAAARLRAFGRSLLDDTPSD